MKSAVKELLYAAGVSHLPKIRDFEQDRLDALEEQLSEPIYLSEVEADLDVAEVIAHTTVSDAVRKECEAELAVAKQNTYRIR